MTLYPPKCNDKVGNLQNVKSYAQIVCELAIISGALDLILGISFICLC